MKILCKLGFHKYEAKEIDTGLEIVYSRGKFTDQEVIRTVKEIKVCKCCNKIKTR